MVTPPESNFRGAILLQNPNKLDTHLNFLEVKQAVMVAIHVV